MAQGSVFERKKNMAWLSCWRGWGVIGAKVILSEYIKYLTWSIKGLV